MLDSPGVGERVPVDIVASGGTRTHETLTASPDGGLAAVCNEDGRPSLFTLADGRWSEAPIDAVRAAYLTFDERGRLIALQRMTIEEAEGVARPGGDLRSQLRLLPEGLPLTGPLLRWGGPVLLTSPDGRRCAAPIPGRDDMYLCVADTADGRVSFTLPLSYGLGYAFGSPPDQAPVLAVVEPVDAEGRQSNPVITIRSAEDGSLVTRLRGHTDHVFTVAFTPDGTRLASAGRDRVIRIWDTATWNEIAALGGPTSFVWSLAFSPDGDILASSGGDRTYRIWRASRGRRGAH